MLVSAKALGPDPNIDLSSAAKPQSWANALYFGLMRFLEYPKMSVPQNALRAQICM